jgi:hypothetical protein
MMGSTRTKNKGKKSKQIFDDETAFTVAIWRTISRHFSLR